MNRLPELVTELSRSGDSNDVAEGALTRLLLTFGRRNERAYAAAVYEAGVIPALVSTLRNFESDERCVWMVCQILLVIMYMPNDPNADIRQSFVRAGGVPPLLNILAMKRSSQVSSRICQTILCLFAWMYQDTAMRAELGQSCSSGNYVGKVIDLAQRTMHSEQCIATSTILLCKMADDPAFLPQIARPVATVGRLNTLLEIMREFAAEDDIVFTIMRLICSLLMDRNQRRRSAMHGAVSRTDVAETVIAIAPIHVNSVRTQTQASTLCELLTERAEFGHDVNASGAIRLIVSAMRQHPDQLPLQRSGIRVITNLFREQPRERISSMILGDAELKSDVKAVVYQARSQFPEDAIVQARCDYFRLLKAVQNGKRGNIILQSVRTPLASVPFMREYNLKRRLI